MPVNPGGSELLRGSVSIRGSAELFGKPDEDPFGPADVAEQVDVLVPDHLADQLGAVRPEASQGVFEVVDGEHHSEVSEGIHRGAPVVGDGRRSEEPGELEPALAVGSAEHRDLDPLALHPRHPAGPFSLDHGAPLERQPQFEEEGDDRVE